MILSDWDKPCSSIHFTRRSVHDLCHSEITCSLYDVERTLDVRIYVSVGRMIRIGNRDQRCKMQDGFTFPHRRSHAIWIAHIPGKYFEISSDVVSAAVKPTPRVEGVVKHKSPHVVPSPHGRLGEMGADESVSA